MNLLGPRDLQLRCVTGRSHPMKILNVELTYLLSPENRERILEWCEDFLRGW